MKQHHNGVVGYHSNAQSTWKRQSTLLPKHDSETVDLRITYYYTCWTYWQRIGPTRHDSTNNEEECDGVLLRSSRGV